MSKAPSERGAGAAMTRGRAAATSPSHGVENSCSASMESVVDTGAVGRLTSPTVSGISPCFRLRKYE